MARNSLDFRPATVDIHARPGQDLTFRVAISDEGITAGTITCTVGGQTPSVDTSLSSTGLLVCDITLTDTQTTALGTTTATWVLSNTVAGVTTPYVCGNYLGSAGGNSSNGLSASVVATTGTAMVQTLVSTSAATALAAHIADITVPHGITHVDQGSTGNLALGQGAAANVTAVSAYGVLAVGYEALANNSTSSGVVALGYRAMAAWTGGGDSVAIGTYALQDHTGAVGETAIGFGARRNATGGANNTAIGDTVLESANGDGNTGAGYTAGWQLVSGDNNVFIGRAAGRMMTSLSEAVVIGASAMHGSTGTPTGTVVIGFGAAANSSGIENVFVGHEAGLALTTGFYNVGVGTGAGATLTTGVNNTFIGRAAGEGGTQKVDAVNTIGLGVGTTTTKDNQVVVGPSSITETILRGLVCIDSNTVAYPALKRSSTTIQARTATDSTFARFQGELQTSVNATLEGGLTPTHTIVLYDAAGQAYRVPCLV